MVAVLISAFSSTGWENPHFLQRSTLPHFLQISCLGCDPGKLPHLRALNTAGDVNEDKGLKLKQQVASTVFLHHTEPSKVVFLLFYFSLFVLILFALVCTYCLQYYVNMLCRAYVHTTTKQFISGFGDVCDLGTIKQHCATVFLGRHIQGLVGKHSLVVSLVVSGLRTCTYYLHTPAVSSI